MIHLIAMIQEEYKYSETLNALSLIFLIRAIIFICDQQSK